MENRPRVVIVGGGFGGLACARALAKAPVDITLLDRRNHHLFQPLLYQVATAALSPSDIASPIRSALARQENVRVLLLEAKDVSLQEKWVETEEGRLPYDYLVLAAGAKNSYLGKPWAKCAPGLKSIEDALEIRRRVLHAYEAAERETDPERQTEWLTFAVVGGGPTGVELAGALAEIGRHTLAKDFRTIDPKRARVVLLEGGDRILPDFPEKNSEAAQRQLEMLGVEVQVGARVSEIEDTGLVVSGNALKARTTLWAAGIRAVPLGGALGVPTDASGRVPVEPNLSIRGFPEAFAIGDMAAIDNGGEVVPGLAPAAAQAGRAAGRNIRLAVRGRPGRPFRYVDKGALATVGRSKAVGHFRGRFAMRGLFAWVLWWAVHLFFLIGFRNRVAVMFGWIWNYLTFQRGARLITEPTLRSSASEVAECERAQLKGPVIDRMADQRASSVRI